MPAPRPAEAQLIYDARNAIGFSIREAARRATDQYGKITEGSWRRTEGYKDVVRTASTVAVMAATVHVTPSVELSNHH